MPTNRPFGAAGSAKSATAHVLLQSEWHQRLCAPWCSLATMRYAVSALLLTLIAGWTVSAQPTVRQNAIPRLFSDTSDYKFLGTAVTIGPSILLTARRVTDARMRIDFSTSELPNIFAPVFGPVGQVLCRDPSSDIAVISTDVPPSVTPYPASFRPPIAGERVTVGGYPGGRWIVSSARVLYIGSITARGSPPTSDGLLLDFDVALAKGAIGAPVIDGFGSVFAIITGASQDGTVAFPLQSMGTCAAIVQKNRSSGSP